MALALDLLHLLDLVDTVMRYVVAAFTGWLILSGRMSYVKGVLRRPDPRRAGAFVVPAEAQERARELAIAGKRIEAIREIRKATGLPFDPALDIVEALRQGAVLPVEESDDRPALDETPPEGREK
ncbi:hypothetical protein OUY22_20640 [Nonomuraea sp. MCN248]|uniref:Ribosomal protein L7/L12 C-terminal domain-containing protein n=1 Tax=Nonomuraea corallina TaxID=2989783 RepID=A0ABT4SFS8_9ACTN|nr:hypothetical protein [Nonomuraea corallina]MDA0635835.1 hypothetical protein [Nonomuraea corallina]